MKSRFYIFSVLMVLAGSVAAYFLVPAYADYRRISKEEERLEQQLAELGIEAQTLEQTIHALINDPQAVERVAREKFGLCREGEQIYHFEAQ